MRNLLTFLHKLLSLPQPATGLDAQALAAIAAAQSISDVEAAHCWALLREAVQDLKVGTGNLRELIKLLRAGSGITLDEYTFEVSEDDPGRVLVKLLDDSRTCSAPVLILELDRLLAQAEKAEALLQSSKPGRKQHFLGIAI